MGDDALVQELASELSRLKLELETEKMCSSSQRLVIAQQEREVKETAKQHAGFTSRTCVPLQAETWVSDGFSQSGNGAP